MLEKWSTWAEELVEQWPDTKGPAVSPDALEIFRTFLDEGAPSTGSTRRAAG